MADVIHGVARWPGVESFLGATYTLSHGISPGVCIYRMAPQEKLPAEFGDLIIEDGKESVVLPGCKVQSMKVERDDRGFYWILEIVDRRWRWQQFGWINGCFNQYAPVGQLRLLPYSVRSPTELAALCLAAMGEVGYVLMLPPGIDYPGPFYPAPVLNTSGVNPPVNWDGVPPAQALQQVADRCGCRILYQWKTNNVLVAPIGTGAKLPAGSIAKKLASILPPKAPSGVGVIGAPTRYQCRLELTAVGEEWDGSYWPINLLSYAPVVPAQPQITQISFFFPAGDTEWKIQALKANGDPYLTASYSANGSDTGATIAAGLVANFNAQIQLHANPLVAALGAQSATMTITGAVGVPFDLNADVVLLIQPWPADDAVPVIEQKVVQAAQDAHIGWDFSMPPEFPNVRATDRLSAADARKLARKSVFRCYQLTGVDVSGKGTCYIPGYGNVLRTTQIHLDDTQVDQITPEPINNNVLISNEFVRPVDASKPEGAFIPVTVNFYNGFARDKPAAVYGSVALEQVLSQVWYPQIAAQAKALQNQGGPVPARLFNTPPGSQVMVPFRVVPEYFMIQFDRPVFARGGETKKGICMVPLLTLQTAVLVRDALNNQYVSFTRIRPLPGGDGATPPAMRHFPDVQANVASVYDKNNKLVSWKILEADPIVRAEHYLDGLQNEYQYKEGQTVEYNGIRALDVDGLTWQVTWTIDESGCSTTASQNAEHSIWIPPYRARLRAEYLPPVTQIDAVGNRVNLVAPVRGAMRGPQGGFRD